MYLFPWAFQHFNPYLPVSLCPLGTLIQRQLSLLPEAVPQPTLRTCLTCSVWGNIYTTCTDRTMTGILPTLQKPQIWPRHRTGMSLHGQGHSYQSTSLWAPFLSCSPRTRNLTWSEYSNGSSMCSAKGDSSPRLLWPGALGLSLCYIQGVTKVFWAKSKKSALGNDRWFGMFFLFLAKP